MNIKNISIKGFRSIKEISISELKQVNLFVRLNNCDKTSVLETFFSFKYAQLSNNRDQTPGLPNFIFNIIDYKTIENKTVDRITKVNIKNKLNSIDNICDNFSHGNMQQLDECIFTSDETNMTINNYYSQAREVALLN